MQEINDPDSKISVSASSESTSVTHEVSIPIQEKQSFLRSKLIEAGCIGFSIMNGALYFLIAVDGGENIINIFKLSESQGTRVIYPISVGASFAYSMFTYKTLEALTLKPDTITKLCLSILAPFSAVAFLTAGQAGALSVGCSAPAAYALGTSLFALRMVNCIDASVKFPKRLIETKESWNKAYEVKNYPELSRLVIVWLSSIGYILCTTDGIYNSMQIISTWFHLNAEVAHWLGIISGTLGALGTLPLNVYWTHRGLRQLTNGGQLQADGTNPDPTDMYTFLALLLVSPIILGILGGASASTGQMFSQLGNSTNYIRIITSIIYAVSASTPGMSTLLRRVGKFTQKYFSNTNGTSTETLLLIPNAQENQQYVPEYDTQEDQQHVPNSGHRVKTFFSSAESVQPNSFSFSPNE